MTISELKQLIESEDKVEFKEAKYQYAYNTSRRSVLGYTVAFANERGSYLIFGVEDAHHQLKRRQQVEDTLQANLDTVSIHS